MAAARKFLMRQTMNDKNRTGQAYKYIDIAVYAYNAEGMKTPASRSPTAPTPGYYLLRLVSKGWGVPCVLFLDDGKYTAIIDEVDVAGEFTSDHLEAMMIDWLTAQEVHPLIQLCLRGEPCDQATYHQRVARKGWAREFSPDDPCLNPRKPMDRRLLRADAF